MAQACGKHFALFLYKNAHLSDDCSIKKSQARKLYNTYKKQNKAKLNFGEILYFSLKFLQRQGDQSILFYSRNKLLQFLENERQIESDFKAYNNITKNKIVSHSLSFSSNKSETQLECKLCEVKFDDKKKLDMHLAQKAHQDINKNLVALEVTINDSAILSNIILRENIKTICSVKVKNPSNKVVDILSMKIDPKKKGIDFNPAIPFTLIPSASISTDLTIPSPKKGVLICPLLLTSSIEGKTKEHTFQMVFHTHDEFYDDLHPTKPYQRLTKPIVQETIESIDSGERPKILTSGKMHVPLPLYRLPNEITTALNTGLKPYQGMTPYQGKHLDYIKSVLDIKDKNNCLTAQNYTSLLSLLIFIEEHQMLKDIRDYDRENQVLVKAGHLLELEVPGLAEGRPSLILSDSVFVRESKQSTKVFEGFVHQVKQSSVLLKFSKNFTSSVYAPNKTFYVSFSFNRYPIRVEHQAVDLIQKQKVAAYFFPKTIQTTSPLATPMTWFNADIANNPEQQQAVQQVLKKTSYPAPYLIYGPPGTGKTMTVVECVKQIRRLTKENVLICTPSNSAANEVARRLLDIADSANLLRYIAPSFPYSQIPKEIIKFSNFKGGDYYQPTLEQITTCGVLITTLTSAAKLVNADISSDYFSYVFVDEAGQATESLTLVAVANILTEKSKMKGQIVLAGDPQQLGPIIHSVLAKEYNFGRSMLERLMKLDPYLKNSGVYNPNALTKLKKNYRSHPVIIETSNRIFYEKELVCAGDEAIINCALNSQFLPNKDFPLIFHSVVGVDQRESNSPSFFNVQEIQIVMDYLDRILKEGLNGRKVTQKQIGVVSPYKKQTEKLIKACRKKKYEDLLIGTVEQVQGQERLVIIMSAVRSRSEFVAHDKKYRLGFLDNGKRFNVAMTRAKALLIVVGNPNLLKTDSNWRCLIEYCANNGAVVGDQFDLNDSKEE